MKSMKATLPNDMSSTNVEIGERNHSYQSAPSSDEGVVENALHPGVSAEQPVPLTSRMKLFIMLVIAAASIILIRSRSGPRGNTTGSKGLEGVTAESVNDATWMAGSTVGTTYCKTSCTSQCSSYFSVYGPLCCDWAEGMKLQSI